MIIAADTEKNDNRRLSSETAETDPTSINSASPPPQLHKIHSSMRHITHPIVAVEETDEETATPTPSVSKLETEKESPISVQDAIKAAYAIMDGVSVSEVNLEKDDEISMVDLNDETSTGDAIKVPKRIRGSTHSRSVGGSTVSALSEVACDRLSTGSSSRKPPFPSNVRILRTPDGKRVNRKKVQGMPARHSFPSLHQEHQDNLSPLQGRQNAAWDVDPISPATLTTGTSFNTSDLSPTGTNNRRTNPNWDDELSASFNSASERAKRERDSISSQQRISSISFDAPLSPGGNSAPERTEVSQDTLDKSGQSVNSVGSTGSQRSYPSSVRILRTPDGRRRKMKKRPSNGGGGVVAVRHSFAGMVTTHSESDLMNPKRPSAITTSSRRIHSDKVVPKPLLLDTDLEKGVKFSSVKIRYYERVVDVNPACSSGVAIGLGWKYNKSRGLSVDEYELQKGGVRYHARQLLLPRRVREDIAKEFGYSQKDIAKGTRANLKIRNERKQTIDNLAMMPMEEKIEGAKRKVRKVLSFRKKRQS